MIVLLLGFLPLSPLPRLPGGFPGGFLGFAKGEAVEGTSVGVAFWVVGGELWVAGGVFGAVGGVFGAVGGAFWGGGVG